MMKLTQERVVGLRRTILHGLTCKEKSLTDLCEDNLAMRKMLEELEVRQEWCPWCMGDGVDRPAHESDCKLKELLG